MERIKGKVRYIGLILKKMLRILRKILFVIREIIFIGVYFLKKVFLYFLLKLFIINVFWDYII